MKWKLLKSNKCPQCSKNLDDYSNNEYLKCPCGFLISWKRFKEIVGSMVEQDIEKFGESDNEEELNNL